MTDSPTPDDGLQDLIADIARVMGVSKHTAEMKAVRWLIKSHQPQATKNPPSVQGQTGDNTGRVLPTDNTTSQPQPKPSSSHHENGFPQPNVNKPGTYVDIAGGDVNKVQPVDGGELKSILNEYTAPKNVKDRHGNEYFDFTFREAKAAIEAHYQRKYAADLIAARIDTAQYIQTNFVSPGAGGCDEILPDDIPNYIIELQAQARRRCAQGGET